MDIVKHIQLTTEVAKSFLGIPYKWGGRSPMEGLDCSHLVCEILRSVNVLENNQYLRSFELWDHFQHQQSHPCEGALFFTKSVM